MIPVLLINNTIVNSSEVEKQYCINNIPNVKKTTLNYTNSQRITTVKLICFFGYSQINTKKKEPSIITKEGSKHKKL